MYNSFDLRSPLIAPLSVDVERMVRSPPISEKEESTSTDDGDCRDEAERLWERGIFDDDEQVDAVVVEKDTTQKEEIMCSPSLFAFTDSGGFDGTRGQVHIRLPDGEGAGLISGSVWRGSLLCAALLTGDHSGLMMDAIGSKDVLEVGCGRGLVGLLCAQLGARVVVLSDCDDRVLKILLAAQRERTEVRHLLWEQDEYELELGRQGEERRHWSVAYRQEEGDIPTLEYGRSFDLLVGSDCIYFPSQEAPLAAVIQQRCRKPHGIAVIVHQPRFNGAMQSVRFVELLRGAGMAVEELAGPWDYDALLKNHVQCFPGQEKAALYRTVHETGPHQVLVARWL